MQGLQLTQSVDLGFKMKKGELVQLSAYGKKLKCLRHIGEDLGLVLTGGFDCALVQWSSLTRPMPMNRRDIKIARSAK